MAGKKLFDSSIEEEKIKKEQDPRIVVATNYKDKRNEPIGVLIISILSILLGGSTTGIFIYFGAIYNVGIIILVSFIWLALLALIVYSIYFYIRNKNMPNEAIYYDEEKKIFNVYNYKTKFYDNYKIEQIKKITYKDHPFFPKTSIFGPVPKKPVGDKIKIELTDNKKISILIADVYKTRKILSEIKK